MSFRKMLILRPVEWVPILLAIIISHGVGFWAMSKFLMIGEIGTEQSGDFTAVENSIRVVNISHWITIPLFVFGVGAWFIRLNRWIMEAKEQ